jgi:hypothetical protein
MAGDTDTAALSLQLRLVRDRLAAAESGLFPTSPSVIAMYRAEIARLEKAIKAFGRRLADRATTDGITSEKVSSWDA